MYFNASFLSRCSAALLLAFRHTFPLMSSKSVFDFSTSTRTFKSFNIFVYSFLCVRFLPCKISLNNRFSRSFIFSVLICRFSSRAEIPVSSLNCFTALSQPMPLLTLSTALSRPPNANVVPALHTPVSTTSPISIFCSPSINFCSIALPVLSINPLLAAVTKSPAPVPAMAPFDASSIIFFRLMSSPLNTSLPISIAPLTIPPPAYSSLIFYPLILESLL